MTMNSILVVDDDPLIRGSLCEQLQGRGYDVELACNGAEALERLSQRPFHLLLTDWKMPEMDGLELLQRVKPAWQDVSVVFLTGFGDIDSAVEAMRRGASDYLTKPVQPAALEETIRRVLVQRGVEVESRNPADAFDGIVGQHPTIQHLFSMIRQIAVSPSTVLIIGESGTGKRVFAYAIHRADPKRSAQPFVEVSCGALPETLLESELFGHVQGAFTGAIRDKRGRFELANGGTIFLDEIDAFSPALQVKLLRVLQERTFERVGDGETMKVDVRVIAATNQNLQELVKAGKFREDLYYRLDVITMRLPALRERKSDIPLLVDCFLQQACQETGKAMMGVSEAALRVLVTYHWPGNIRELENAIRRAVILARQAEIRPDDLSEVLLRSPVAPARDDEQVDSSGSLKARLHDPERQVILEALAAVRWNRTLAAKRLGIHRSTLYHKLRKYAAELDTTE